MKVERIFTKEVSFKEMYKDLVNQMIDTYLNELIYKENTTLDNIETRRDHS